jgi:uncharacterized delta-60 repeat protein
MKPKFYSRRIEMNSNKAVIIRESNNRKTINPVKVFHLLRGISAVLVLLTFAACGRGVPPPVTAIIGPSGGTVTGPSGAQVVIPEGALSQEVEIGIAQTDAGAPALPSGATSLGATFAFTPHGTTFAVPVTMTVPFNAGTVPSGTTPTLFKTNAAQSAFEAVAGATVNGNSMTAQVTSFSFANVGKPVETVGGLSRFYLLARATKDGSPNVLDGSLTGSQEKATLRLDGSDQVTFDTDTPSDVGVAEVFASVDGKTYWASVEEAGLANVSLSQSFVKRSADAKARLILSDINIEALDFNPNFSTSELAYSRCSELTADMTTAVRVASCGLIYAHVQFFATASNKQKTFLYVNGQVGLKGFLNNWVLSIRDSGDALQPFWVNGAPIGTGLETLEPKVTLPRDIVLNIDLSSVPVCPPEREAKDCKDSEFTINSSLTAYALNLRKRESGLTAMIRDPLSISGSSLTVEGLEATNNPAAAPIGVEEPLPCAAPNPAAGVLQFSSPTYDIAEGAFRTSDILVTRTGGSEGAVSVTFRASDGTAVNDVDYSAPAVTVFFGDGDTEPRFAQFTALPDTETEPDKTVNLLLSEPGGCATLGAQASAVVTLLDDDDLPPPSSDTFLDPNFGNEGKAFSERFGGDRSAMALQPDGKIIMVGGTFTDFILARFNADGTLDTSFDGDGKITTDLAGGFNQEEALGVAVQPEPDGKIKIIVVGYVRNPEFNFALVRYNSDGSLDTSFDGDGIVTSGVAGRANAVAIQPDGKIVVVGEREVSSGDDFSDFVVARYNSNGSLDTSFNGTGQIVTDFGGLSNSAKNVVVQNGAIVVSGKPTGNFVGSDHTDVARYNPNGSLDNSFDGDGKLTLAGKIVGEGLAIQSDDGKLILVGSANPDPSRLETSEFAVTRLNADGSPDTDFGSAGTVTTPVSGKGDSANAVALQGDGRIIVVGSSLGLNRNFAVARYNTNGTLDADFADAGTLTIDFFSFTDIAESVAVQDEGKIVVGGVAEDSFDGYGLVRINP